MLRPLTDRIPVPLQEAWSRLRARLHFARLGPLPAADEARLRAFCEGGSPLYVFAPGLSWDRQLFQRPQHLALALGRLGERVVYLEPYPARAGVEPVGEGVLLLRGSPRLLQPVETPVLYLLTWSISPQADLRSPALLYDIVDDFSVFRQNRGLLAARHAARLRSARLALATSRALWEAYRADRADLLYCPNGVDYAHFHRPPGPVPADLADWSGGPLIGYYGALAEWFDYDLLHAVARLRPDWRFVLIGPAAGEHLRQSGLLDLPNLRWLGRKPYADLPDYLARFDAAVIPFRVNAATDAVSPLKLFEYMAGGKPVVATPMRESAAVAGVLTGATPQAFADRLDEALARRKDAEILAVLDRTARENTWEARARQIADGMKASSRMV